MPANVNRGLSVNPEALQRQRPRLRNLSSRSRVLYLSLSIRCTWERSLLALSPVTDEIDHLKKKKNANSVTHPKYSIVDQPPPILILAVVIECPRTERICIIPDNSESTIDRLYFSCCLSLSPTTKQHARFNEYLLWRAINVHVLNCRETWKF